MCILQDWYCEEDAAPRQDFRRRRAEELLQSRRHTATLLLAYVPTPFLFRELPRPIPPPLPKTVSELDRGPVLGCWGLLFGGQHAKKEGKSLPQLSPLVSFVRTKHLVLVSRQSSLG